MMPLTVLTWNTLAPVYFREGPRRGGTVEARLPAALFARHTRICEKLASSGADVLCLQEQWFEPKLLELYRAQLDDKAGFRFHSLQRTAWNRDGRSEDGVAVLTRRGLEVVLRHDIKFHDYDIPQDRVGVLLLLRDVRSGDANDGPLVAVLGTHLTYAHSEYEEHFRRAQIAACISAADLHVPRGVPLVVAGDLNGPSTDGVAQVLRKAGFRNAWEDFHGSPCQITHIDHRGDNFAADHVWVRGMLAPKAAMLLPPSVPDDRPMRRPTIGGAAALVQQSRERPLPQDDYDEWCELSDHRPLVVTLSVPE